MKKIAIFTLTNENNFGNRLQNYAVQEILKKNNIKVETVSNQLNIYGRNYIIKKIKDIIKKFLFFVPKYVRTNNFIKFNKKYVKFSKYHIDKNHIPKELSHKYDYYITGSDQVWNPNFSGRSDIDFLTFVPKEKRNAFSASFGISEIPEEHKERYKKNLSQMNLISVRENRAKEIIEELTGRTDVEVLLDPTMLLIPEEWDKVSKKPKKLKTNKYILNYYLGELTEDRKKIITDIAKKNNCKIINLMDKSEPLYVSGPSEFLYLVKNAFLVCTDSFHGAVFSIIYNTPFVIFERKDSNVKMNSRLDTLLSKFNLEYRKFNGNIEKEVFDCNYQKIDNILTEERKKSQEFIKKVLET